jgi:hypothetical protein
MDTKKFFLIIFLLNLLINFSYGIDLFYSDIGTTIRITDTTMNVEIYNFSGELETKENYNVDWETINNIRYLNFNYNGTFLDPYKGPKIPHGIKRYLVIEGSYFLYFYNEKNIREFAIAGGKAPLNWSNVTTISATSELKENNTIYSVKNLYNISILIPWVEGVSGDGIGEKIRIEMEQSRRRPDGLESITSLFISNGFVDYNRPDLYEYNNRLKKIRVHNIGYNEYFDFIIDDNPDIKWIRFKFNNPSYIIEIEILEVHKGTRWDDTCVNFIIPCVY